MAGCHVEHGTRGWGRVEGVRLHWAPKREQGECVRDRYAAKDAHRSPRPSICPTIDMTARDREKAERRSSQVSDDGAFIHRRVQTLPSSEYQGPGRRQVSSPRGLLPTVNESWMSPAQFGPSTGRLCRILKWIGKGL
eukprot:scaffold201170_cov33-Tisochrysis_lutea.AAC.2